MGDSTSRADRFCLAFLAETQCRKAASWVCLNRDGMMWFACEEHADQHAYLRCELTLFLQHAVAGKEIPAEAWEKAPGYLPGPGANA